MRKDVPEETSLPRDQGRTELMGTGVPEVIVLEARAALGTLRASERKRENILLSILGLIKTCGYGGDFEDVFLCCRFLQLEERLGIKPSGARVA